MFLFGQPQAVLVFHTLCMFLVTKDTETHQVWKRHYVMVQKKKLREICINYKYCHQNGQLLY